MAERIETRNEKLETGIEQKTGLIDVQERANSHEIPKEIQTWMDKIEQDPVTPQTGTDDTGAPLMITAQPQSSKIQLPLTRVSFIAGFKKKIDDAGKWLSTFVLRMIKMKEGSVKFKEE